MTHVERFAPSPTGPLHLGHAFSAITAWNAAMRSKGVFLLRIEDTDQSRARPEWETQIYDDLNWLGLSWPEPVVRQSDQFPTYRAALASLWDRGLIYACSCKRRDIVDAASAPQEGGPVIGPDGIVYPGTCRDNAPNNNTMPLDLALRLNMTKAISQISSPLCFYETGTTKGTVTTEASLLPETVGDVVLGRPGSGTSYHLSVVIDDAAQGVTHVTRGEDLFDATVIHIVLQDLLDLARPIYNHHALVRDEGGKRLAKRTDAKSIHTYRSDGATPKDVYKILGITPLARP